MLEAPEVEGHLHHKTGHSMADKILAVLAVFLSIVSVVIAVGHGKTMERLVAANSWPNLSYATGNESEDGRGHDIIFEIRNTGVGPARIDTVELFYKGVPVASGPALMKACCGVDKADLATSYVRDEVLPATSRRSYPKIHRQDAKSAKLCICRQPPAKMHAGDSALLAFLASWR
jgi:hypothetical protein